jgi:hypothetical protein
MMYLSKFACDLEKNPPLESRRQESSIFGVVDEEENIGNDE